MLAHLREFFSGGWSAPICAAGSSAILLRTSTWAEFARLESPYLEDTGASIPEGAIDKSIYSVADCGVFPLVEVGIPFWAVESRPPADSRTGFGSDLISELSRGQLLAGSAPHRSPTRRTYLAEEPLVVSEAARFLAG